MLRWLSRIALEWLLVTAALIVAWRWPLLSILSLIVIGTRQQSIGILGHEATHHAIGLPRKSPWTDRLANWLVFWPLGVDSATYRVFHLQHHAHLNDPLRDSELLLKARFPHQWTDLTPRKRRRLLALDCLGWHWRETMMMYEAFRGPMSWPRALYVVAFYGIPLALGWWPLVLLWLTAFFTVHLAAFRARLFHEHAYGGITVWRATWWQRWLYVPHNVWNHPAHHAPGHWSDPFAGG